MKNLSAISKKGIIVISAVIMIMAGTFVALLPSTLRACGHGDMGTGTSYIHVPILNNTGETLTIREMFIDTPDIPYVCKEWKSGNICTGECKKTENEIRVKAISFGGTDYYTTGTSGYSHCHKHGEDPLKIINHTDYPFSGAKVECKIAFDVCPYDLPSGSYTIRYYFRYAGDTADRMNEIKFNLP